MKRRRFVVDVVFLREEVAGQSLLGVLLALFPEVEGIQIATAGWVCTVSWDWRPVTT